MNYLVKYGAVACLLQMSVSDDVFSKKLLFYVVFIDNAF